jgi:hypothetical protein
LTIQAIKTARGEPLTEHPGASEQRRERSEALAGAGGGAPAQIKK